MIRKGRNNNDKHCEFLPSQDDSRVSCSFSPFVHYIFHIFSCTQFILIFIALKSFMNIQNILLQKLHNAPFFTCVSCVWQIVHYSRYFWSRFNALKKCAMMDTRIFICFFSVFRWCEKCYNLAFWTLTGMI
jgi:hypothetical protein